MEINKTPILHGIIFTTLLMLPTVWSTITFDDDTSHHSDITGSITDYTIPANEPEVESWFSKTIKHAKERKEEIQPNILVAEAKTEIIKVRTDGSGKFKTIKEALDSVEAKGNNHRVIIDIGSGFYNEKITIGKDKPYITLYGDLNDTPTLIFDASTPKFGSMDTATLTVEGDYFSAVNILIVNDAKPKNGRSSLALRVMGNYASFYNCTIVASENVIYDEQGWHLFKDCKISGSNKIIVGNAKSVYLESDIIVRPHKPSSTIVSQVKSNPADQTIGGFVFAHCRISGEPGVKAYLGLADVSGAVAVYAYSNLTNVVDPEGWLELDLDGEENVVCGEYNNVGEGADMSRRINKPCTKKVTENNVQPFLNLDIIRAYEWLLPAPRLIHDSPKKI